MEYLSRVISAWSWRGTGRPTGTKAAEESGVKVEDRVPGHFSAAEPRSISSASASRPAAASTGNTPQHEVRVESGKNDKERIDSGVQEATERFETLVLTPGVAKSGLVGGKLQGTAQLERAEILTFGRMFALLHEPFLEKSWLKRNQPPPGPLTDPYESEDSHLDSIVREVYIMIPEMCHGLVQTSEEFQAAFKKGCEDLVQKVSRDAREKTGHAIFNPLNPSLQEVYQANDPGVRRRNPEFRRLIVWDDESRNESFLRPVHFPSQKYDLTKVFEVTEIALIIRAILWGGKSIGETPGSTSWRSGPSAYGNKWRIRQITPGLLALAATIAVFIHQPDKKLEPVGKESSFQYKEAFWWYKEYFVRGLNSEETAKGMAELFKWHNEKVFPGSVEGTSLKSETGQKSVKNKTEMTEALKAKEEKKTVVTAAKEEEPLIKL